MNGPTFLCDADRLLYRGRTYFLEYGVLADGTRDPDDSNDDVLATLVDHAGPRPGYLIFDILAVRPGPGVTMRDPNDNSLHVAMNHNHLRVTEVARDELTQYLDMPCKTELFDRALRGEELA